MWFSESSEEEGIVFLWLGKKDARQYQCLPAPGETGTAAASKSTTGTAQASSAAAISAAAIPTTTIPATASQASARTTCVFGREDPPLGQTADLVCLTLTAP